MSLKTLGVDAAFFTLFQNANAQLLLISCKQNVPKIYLALISQQICKVSKIVAKLKGII